MMMQTQRVPSFSFRKCVTPYSICNSALLPYHHRMQTYFLRASTLRLFNVSNTIRTFSSSYPLTMSSSGAASDDKVNATGLTPAESQKLAHRQPRSDEEPILSAIRDLYLCKPKESSYAVYAENAVFHDPVSIAEGIARIRAQFNALPKAFPRSTIDRFDVLESPKTLANSILVDQDVTYYRSENLDEKPFKTMNSLLTIIKDNQGKILTHTEEWNHNRVTDGSNAGFFGMLNEGRKKAFAALSMPFVDQTPPQDRK